MDILSSRPYPYRLLLQSLHEQIRPYRGRFWFASIMRLSSDLVALYVAWVLSKLVAFFVTYEPGASLRRFWFLLGVWFAAIAYTAVARQVAKFLCYNISEQVNVDSQLSAFTHLQSLDSAWHEKENTGNKLKRVQNGGEGFKKLIRIWIDNIIEITVNFVGMSIILSVVDPRVSAIMAVFLVTYTVIAIPLARRASANSREVNALEEEFTGLAFEIINNIRSVKVMGMFSQLFTLLKQQGVEVLAAVRKRVMSFRSKSAIQRVWAHVFQAVAIGFIAYGIYQGRYDVAFLVLFNYYFGNLHTSAAELSEISQDVTIARYHIARYHSILAQPILIDSVEEKKSFPKNWKEIELKNVTFAYGSNVVLNDISFTIRRGERVGIVGLSGSGKSTLFKLLLKEYENFAGDILIDGLSIRKIKKSSYIEHVAVVLQETEVFNFSLRDNIAIGSKRNRVTAASLETAIETAHVVDFLGKLPQGLDTVIGEKGVKLSGGEKQRVGIARAVFKKPDILFLDEATSHLDLESEEKIQDSLHSFFRQVTAVVIAHRLTTIQQMDRILLIEGGVLLEEGDFATLYKKRGRFFDLWEKQKL